jgi:trigger factor
LANQQKAFGDAPEGKAAETGDAVVIDFVGRLGAEKFDGGSAEDVQLELGSGQFIPGFEDQLLGAKAGEERSVNVSFPRDYGAKNLAGKAATFAVTVKSVKVAKPAEVNEDMAKGFGLESLEKLKEIVQQNLDREHAALARTLVKRKLLDALALEHKFDVPPSMVESEFEQIWRTLEREVADDAEEKAKLEAEKDEYRGIAERRVRLGLLLSEIGQASGVQITSQEMQQLVIQEARKYPGEEMKVAKFFQENQMAAAQLRAPLYEEKVVDHILGVISLTDKTVTRAELEAALQDEETSAAPKAEEAPKKGKAKKAAKETSVEAEIVPAETAPAAQVEAAAEPEAKKPAKKKAVKAKEA